jgi:hypothetical protein
MSFIQPSYNLIQSKYAFLVFSVLLIFFISIKSNHYTINTHSLFALGIVWFIWFPLFDILFLHQYIPYSGLYETRIDFISQRDDNSFIKIILTASALLIGYLFSVSIIAKFLRLPKNSLTKQNTQSYINYTLLWIVVVALLVMYLALIINNLTSPADFTHWTEEKLHGDGVIGFFLSNGNFFLISIIYFLIFYTYRNSKIGRNLKIAVHILLLTVIVFYFLDNSRIFLLAFLVGLAAVFERLGQEIKWGRIFIFGLFFFCFMIFVSLRRSFLDLDFFQLIGQLNVFGDLGLLNIARKEFEWYPGLGYWLELYDLNAFNNFPYSSSGYLFKIFFFWMPDGLFSFQEGPFTAYLGYYLTGDQLFSCNITSIGEIAIMFGWPAVLAFGIFAGISAYLLDIRYLRNNSNFTFLIFAVILLQIFRGPFYYFLSQILLLIIAWGFIFKFVLQRRA